MFYSSLQPEYKTTVTARDAMNSDIITAIHGALPKAARQVSLFAQQFKAGSSEQTAYNIWNYLKNRIRYVKDSEEWQLVKLPSRLIAERSGDCKSYSLFTAAILKALNMPASFRYASYTNSPIPSHVYTTTTDEAGREIIVDAVWNKFDDEKPYTHKKDYQVNVAVLSGITGVTEFAQALKNAVAKFVAAYKRAPSPSEFSTITVQEWRKLYPSYPTPPEYLPLKSDQKLATLQDIANALGRARVPADQISKITVALKNAWQQAHPSDFVFDSGSKFVLSTRSPNILEVIKDFGASVYNIIKTVALAPSRAAFLSLVALNVRGLATNLKRGIDKNPGAVKSTWESLGGSYSALQRVVNSGAKKSSLFGIGAVQVAALLATAGPVIAIVLKGLKAIGVDTSEIEDAIDAVKQAGGDTTPPSNLPGKPEAGSEYEDFTINPTLLIAAAVGVFLLFNN